MAAEARNEPRQAGQPQALRREVGVVGATLLGLGSILGTGVFVSLALATEAAGPAVVLAVVVAAIVAMCNALSSAQLAANHPVSGGTYEYGYRWLWPALGFTAGWMFLCAKTASAAAAALGFAGYFLHAFDKQFPTPPTLVALLIVVLFTVLVLAGLKRSSFANSAIVGITLAALTSFVIVGFPSVLGHASLNLLQRAEPHAHSVETTRPLAGFLEACALMFVAFTGYGRIATLGEEIRDPRRNIPRAILSTLVVSALLYVAVAVVAIAALGAEKFAAAGKTGQAPLESAARALGVSVLPRLVALGAMTAMLGVLLNLILGLSRVVLAMGRRGDLPAITARVTSHGVPNVAVIMVGLAIAALALIGNLKTTWSFSAFAVLVYYALTNLAALRLSAEERLYPRYVAWVGLVACLFLAFWVEPHAWLTGLALLALGLIWHTLARRKRRQRSP